MFPLVYENHNLKDINTPVKHKILEKLLVDTGYNEAKTQYLVQGFKEGFDLQYEGLDDRQDYSHNLPLRVGTKMDIWEKIMKEVKEGRVAGPFKQIPFKNFVQSPIGLVPKDNGRKTRMIFHLSYDFKNSGYGSINSYIPAEKYSVTYQDIDAAIKSSYR